MTSKDPSQNNSISIGGSVSNSPIVQGNNNQVSFSQTNAQLPPPESVNIQEEIAALRELIMSLNSPDQSKLENAVDDIQQEVTKDEPDRDEVGEALNRAIKYASKAGEFADSLERFQGPVTRVVAWLGENWYKLLPLVGLAI